MMDQLKSELAPYGISELPAGWQFVHVDVPKSGDGGAIIATVAQQGGAYISTAPASGSKYANVDATLTAKLVGSGELPRLGTWLPRNPEDVTVPITVGAGQLRAVGRTLTLAQSPTVFAGLRAAWERLFSDEAEMHRVSDVAGDRFGDYNQADDPIVFVISSMAGGAGASMALDICRILTGIPNLDPRLMGVFMFSPDTFNELAPSDRGGVRANGLAMLGEIVASQTRSANAHDVAVLTAMGIATDGTAVPFARVFPVGRTMGVTETVFGDGTMKGVYRGLGRGLAGLVASDAAMAKYVQYDLGNSNPTQTDRSLFGWGESARDLQWGSFGFASLNMGRDRYRHYAAQRLARSAVDRLVTGHRRGADSRSTDDVILNALVDSTLAGVLARLELPADANRQGVAAWFRSAALRPGPLQVEVKSIIDSVVSVGLPPAAGNDARQWLQAVSQHLTVSRAAINSAVSKAAYRWAYEWVPALEQRLVDEVAHAIAQFGLPYARAVLARIQTIIENSLQPALQALAEYPIDDPAKLPEAVSTPVSAMRGPILNPDGITQVLLEGIAGQLRQNIYARGAEALARVLGPMIGDALQPLRDEISEALKLLSAGVVQPVAGIKLADVDTTVYAAWPSDQDARVPDRFDVAQNEILLTPASGFDVQYSTDVRASVPQALGTGYEEAQAVLVAQVITGLWPVAAGAVPPGGLLERKTPWRAAYFNTDPATDAGLVPSRARYSLHLSTADLRDRAIAFVSRRGEPFDAYCSVSLRRFALGDEHTPTSEITERHDLIVRRFRETLALALPLVGVSEQAVLAVHGEGVSYRFKFSNLPFQSSPALVARLSEIVRHWPNIDATTVQDFDRAFTDNANATKVDVFGSYKSYAPVVFSGLLDPVKEQWGITPSFGREAFWAHRRSRPLRGSLPVGDTERRAMVAGWYIGRVTGRIKVPTRPYTDPVQIVDGDSGTWLSFPNPLLTPPDRFRGGDFDWLPSVLESQLVAVAQVNNPPVLASLAPYRRLREVYDASPDGQGSADVGGLTSDLAGQTILAEWLRTGAVPAGGGNVFAGQTPDERADAVRNWLTQQRATLVAQFSAPVTNRRDAAATPLFRDIVEDADWALGEIDRLLVPALAEAKSIGLPGSGDVVIL
jgi:hypothetical protein